MVEKLEFNELLKKSRVEHGMTQQQVADKIGIDKSTYCGYETGKRQPDPRRIVQIAKALGVSPNVFFDGENEKAPILSVDSTGGKISVNELTDILLKLGFITQDADLSDSDLRFLISVGEVIRSWFRFAQ